MKIARWPALVLIPALLIAALLATDDEVATVDAVAGDTQALGPVVASPDSLGAFWFCAGGTGIEGGAADHNVTVINTTDEERFITLTIYSSRPQDGTRPDPVQANFDLKPYGRTEHQLRSFLLGGQAEYVSATVEIDGGGVLVEHAVSGPQGSDRAPCASSASATWTVPLGATDTAAPNAVARELLVFFNPYPADAVLEVSFSTDRGARGTPEFFDGMVIPGRSVVGVDLAAAGVTVSTQVSAEVVTRVGRVVVDRIQIFADPTRGGMALSSGVATAAESWVFPAGGMNLTRREQLFVSNPGDIAAEVDVEVRPSSGDIAPEPFALTIQPDNHVMLDLGLEERLQSLVEGSVPYSLIVRTADGTSVAAERVVWVTPGQPGAGVATSTGSALAGLRLTADMTGATAGSELVLMNPSAVTLARVRIRVITPTGDGGGRINDPSDDIEVELDPGSRRVFTIEELGAVAGGAGGAGGAGVIVVESNVPVLAERDVVVAGERWMALAVPDVATASIAEPSLFSDVGG